MSKVQTLRAFVNQRLTVAAEEIFGMFERTIEDYEEELCRQRTLLNAVFNPEVRLHRADTELLLLSYKEGPPEQQECSTSRDLQDAPEQPHIKKEQGELWTTLEGEQLQGLEEANMTKCTSTHVHVKSEKDEKKPQSSQLYQSQTEENRYSELVKTEADGEDCGEPAKTYNPVAYDKMSDSSEPETDDSRDWEEIREHQSSINLFQKNEVPVSYMECSTGKTSVSTSKCASSFSRKGHLQKHNGIQTGIKPFGCPVCGKRYPLKNSLKSHMRLHSEGKHFRCSVCNKSFPWKVNFELHMRIHTGERPYCCSVCSMRFSQKEHLKQHTRIHTGEKPFCCSVCGRRFAQSSALTRHSRLHTGEKPFTCTFCKASFRVRRKLAAHMRVHNVEKPFSCSVCGKRFILLTRLEKHKCVGESSESK